MRGIMGESETLRRPCPTCGYVEGYIEAAGPHQKMLCMSCHSYQYMKPKDRSEKPGYKTLVTLHKVNGRSFYAGKMDGKSVFLRKNDDGSLCLSVKL